MSISAIHRRCTGTWGRFVLGVVAVAWLNVVAQPCLMAMEPAPESTVDHAHAAHSAHAEHSAQASGASGCGHCPPGVTDREVPCETRTASGCDSFAGYEIDARHFELQLKDVPAPIALPAFHPRHCEPTFAGPMPPLDRRQRGFPGDPPLNLRHCVFLK